MALISLRGDFTRVFGADREAQVAPQSRKTTSMSRTRRCNKLFFPTSRFKSNHSAINWLP